LSSSPCARWDAATAGAGAASNHSGQYTGRENDATGLYYYRARYYSPAFQRFISEDPIGLAGGINQYSYVEGSPIDSVDPSGLDGISHQKPRIMPPDPNEPKIQVITDPPPHPPKPEVVAYTSFPA
jgi:RHS repeat-associated protein